MSFTFRHGVHPPDAKSLTARLPLRRMPYPEEMVLPLKQHAGPAALAVVKEGERVRAGEVVAAPAPGALGARIHASIDGVVRSVGGSVRIEA